MVSVDTYYSDVEIYASRRAHLLEWEGQRPRVSQKWKIVRHLRANLDTVALVGLGDGLRNHAVNLPAELVTWLTVTA